MVLIMYNKDRKLANIGVGGDHQMMGKCIGTFYSIVNTQKGLFFTIWQNYAHVSKKAQLIHSKIQLQSHGVLLSDIAISFGGLYHVFTASGGHEIPIRFIDGLPYIEQHCPTLQQLDTLDHVIMTGGSCWIP